MGYGNTFISRELPADPAADLKPNDAPRILLVEDNDLNRLLLYDYLVVLGYQVFTLTGSSSFFQALSDFQPHLILLDLKLPGIDGYTLLKQLQQQTQWWDIPAIVVSALASLEDQQRALGLGASRYLVKPVSLQNLAQVIQDELSASSTGKKTSLREKVLPSEVFNLARSPY